MDATNAEVDESAVLLLTVFLSLIICHEMSCGSSLCEVDSVKDLYSKKLEVQLDYPKR